MSIRIAENDKRPRVSYAMTDDGIELPVIDVTSPAFRVDMSPHELAAATEKAMTDMKSRLQLPPQEQQRQIQGLWNESFLAPRIAAARGKVLDGMSTYFLKLGPANLGRGWARDIDYAIAASLPCLSNRLRLQDMARLQADSLAPLLDVRPGRPLHMLNIAGGPGMDSLGAILLLRREHPQLLGGRTIVVHLLDPDAAGPSFGARAVAAIQAVGGPLHGVDVEMRHEPYDWSSPRRLRELTLSVRAQDAVIACSSEGGLFEYGSDEDIVANLRAFGEAAGAQAVAAGSVTRADGFSRVLYEAGDGAAVRLRGMDAFADLAHIAGWRVTRVVDNPLSHSASLVRDTAARGSGAQ
jgi:hypothetical protein